MVEVRKGWWKFGKGTSASNINLIVRKRNSLTFDTSVGKRQLKSQNSYKAFHTKTLCTVIFEHPPDVVKVPKGAEDADKMIM